MKKHTFINSLFCLKIKISIYAFSLVINALFCLKIKNKYLCVKRSCNHYNKMGLLPTVVYFHFNSQCFLSPLSMPFCQLLATF